jgi:hypothetical protein
VTRGSELGTSGSNNIAKKRGDSAANTYIKPDSMDRYNEPSESAIIHKQTQPRNLSNNINRLNAGGMKAQDNINDPTWHPSTRLQANQIIPTGISNTQITP